MPVLAVVNGVAAALLPLAENRGHTWPWKSIILEGRVGPVPRDATYSSKKRRIMSFNLGVRHNVV